MRSILTYRRTLSARLAVSQFPMIMGQGCPGGGGNPPANQPPAPGAMPPPLAESNCLSVIVFTCRAGRSRFLRAGDVLSACILQGLS